MWSRRGKKSIELVSCMNEIDPAISTTELISPRCSRRSAIFGGGGRGSDDVESSTVARESCKGKRITRFLPER